MVPWKPFQLAVLAILVGSALAGCNRKSDGDATYDQSAERRATLGTLKRQLDEASDRLQTLEDRAARAGSKVRQELRDEIAALGKIRDDLYGKLQELHAEGVEGWEKLKEDAAVGVDTLGRAVNRTWKKVAEEDRTAEADAKDR